MVNLELFSQRLKNILRTKKCPMVNWPLILDKLPVL